MRLLGLEPGPFVLEYTANNYHKPRRLRITIMNTRNFFVFSRKSTLKVRKLGPSSFDTLPLSPKDPR